MNISLTKLLNMRHLPLRDYFAGEAMKALLSSPRFDSSKTIKNVVTDAYAVADTMLEVRK